MYFELRAELSEFGLHSSTIASNRKQISTTSDKHILSDHLLAMPEMTRSWIVTASLKHSELRFDIREPPFEGDNLGLKTWGTAFAISKKLESLGTNHFSHLLNKTEDYFTSEAGLTLAVPKVRVLEYVYHKVSIT